MNQKALFHESIEDALWAVVEALGGPKKVGAALWPEKTIEDAGKLLRHCLDEDRAEKLSLGQLLWILKEGRKVNSHDAVDYLCQQAGYKEPDPIEPQEEQASLMRDAIAHVKEMKQLVERMEALQPLMRAVK
jgi:hypothetical protein